MQRRAGWSSAGTARFSGFVSAEGLVFGRDDCPGARTSRLARCTVLDSTGRMPQPPQCPDLSVPVREGRFGMVPPRARLAVRATSACAPRTKPHAPREAVGASACFRVTRISTVSAFPVGPRGIGVGKPHAPRQDGAGSVARSLDYWGVSRCLHGVSRRGAVRPSSVTPPKNQPSSPRRPPSGSSPPSQRQGTKPHAPREVGQSVPAPHTPARRALAFQRKNLMRREHPGRHSGKGQGDRIWRPGARIFTSPPGRGRREASGEGGATSTTHCIRITSLTRAASRHDLSQGER